MSSHVAWSDIRAEHVARAGGEAAVEAGKRQLLAEVVGHRLAEVRRARGLTQQQVADRMGVSKGRISQIERGKISGQEVLSRYATPSAAGSTKPSTSTTETSPPSPDWRPRQAQPAALPHSTPRQPVCRSRPGRAPPTATVTDTTTCPRHVCRFSASVPPEQLQRSPHGAQARTGRRSCRSLRTMLVVSSDSSARFEVITGGGATDADPTRREPWPPAWVGSIVTDDEHLAERARDVMRAELDDQ